MICDKASQIIGFVAPLSWQVKMLEALQDIEVASRLVGFDIDNADSIDAKYKKLRCCINPLSHDSEEYQLIKKYLHKTHAPTHMVGFCYCSIIFINDSHSCLACNRDLCFFFFGDVEFSFV